MPLLLLLAAGVGLYYVFTASRLAASSSRYLWDIDGFKIIKYGVAKGLEGEIYYKIGNPTGTQATLESVFVDGYLDTAYTQKLFEARQLSPQVIAPNSESRLTIPFRVGTITLGQLALKYGIQLKNGELTKPKAIYLKGEARINGIPIPITGISYPL